MENQPKVSFLVFFCMWADRMRWIVPPIHAQACVWLENKGDLAVLRCFRGFAKSTILAVYNAWRYYKNDAHRILHQSESDGTAYKTSRDTQNVLRNHPLTVGMLPPGKGTVEQWWVTGADDIDARNASMYAKGILSNVTSARADECQNDDVEVPRNIQTVEAREKLRYRLGEQTHILVPGGTKLYVGTPHTHDSLYDELEAMGADCLTIKMFGQEFRVEKAQPGRIKVPFVPEFVFYGIGPTCKVLAVHKDYTLTTDGIELLSDVRGLIDFYAGSAWPERFNAKEMQKRRRETKTINEWDSQYQLHSKPISETRLDPAKIIAYAVEPELKRVNSTASMWLGKVRIAGMSLRWDPASGKIDSDVSAAALLLQDEHGRRYLHRTIALTGEIAEFDDDGKTITGGQVWQLCDLVKQYHAPRVVIETNGIGQFAPAVLKACLKQRKLQCGVAAEPSILNKNKRILEAFEPVISARMLWAHVSVLDGPFHDQMKDFNPETKNQADDYIDVAAAAITDTPERLKVTGDTGPAGADWRPSSGVHEVELAYD